LGPSRSAPQNFQGSIGTIGPVRAPTSFVHARDPDSPGMTVLAAAVPDVPASVLPVAPAYPYLRAIGCPADLAAIEQSIASAYRPIVRGEGYTIFSRQPVVS